VCAGCAVDAGDGAWYVGHGLDTVHRRIACHVVNMWQGVMCAVQLSIICRITASKFGVVAGEPEVWAGRAVDAGHGAGHVGDGLDNVRGRLGCHHHQIAHSSHSI
jgi:hypothetical protein